MARKTGQAMGGCVKRDQERLENNSERQNELETDDSERSERNVRRERKRRRKDESNYGQPHPRRQEQAAEISNGTWENTIFIYSGFLDFSIVFAVVAPVDHRPASVPVPRLILFRSQSKLV